MKISTFAILMLLSVSSYAQRFDTWTVSDRLYSKKSLEDIRKFYPDACKFYKSLEDYKDSNPVSGMDWKPGSWKSEKLTVLKNGVEEKTKVSDLGQYWITDEQGLIMRIVGEDMFWLVINDHYCYYIRYGYGYVYLREDDTFSFGTSDGAFYEYISEGLSGEMIKMYNNDFEKLVKDHGLWEAYKNDKPQREMHDSVSDWESKLFTRQMKYFAKINEIYKKKG